MLSLAIVLSLAVTASATSPIDETSISVQRVEAVLKVINARQDSCHDAAKSNQEMIACEYQAYENADKLLNSEYQAIVKSLKTESDEYKKETLNRLKAAQVAWIAFRDANCSLEATDMLGGSGENLVRAGCLSGATKARVLELVKLLGE